MAASIETKRKLRAINRLSQSFPDHTAEDRLKQIGDVLSGKIEAGTYINTTSPTLLERLKAGQESRSPRNAADRVAKKAKDEPEDEKKRKKRGGHDRMESGGINRSTDVNL